MKQLVTGVLVYFICSSATAEYCTFAREEISGNNKFCFYSCVKGEQVVTINSLYPCPLMRNFATSTYGDPTITKQLVFSAKYIGGKYNASCVSK
jgi:hypothetical protein